MLSASASWTSKIMQPSASIILAAAIASEVIATSALKASDGFSRPWPSVVTGVGYLISFYLLSQALKTIPVGVAYAIWSGAGIVLISIIGWVLFQQKLDAAAVLGMGLIISGVVVLNVFSTSQAH